MSSGACGRPLMRRGGKEVACGTLPPAHPLRKTLACHPASADAPPTAARTPPRPATSQEALAPHNMLHLTPRPAARPCNPMGGYSLGCAGAARWRRSLPPQPSSPDPGPRTNPPRLPQGTADHRDPHPPQPSVTTPEAPDRPTTATLRAGRAGQEPTQPDDPPNITPCSDPSLPAVEHHAEPRPEKATRTWSQWTPTRPPTGTCCAPQHQTQACSRQNRLTHQSCLAPAKAQS